MGFKNLFDQIEIIREGTAASIRQAARCQRSMILILLGDGDVTSLLQSADVSREISVRH